MQPSELPDHYFPSVRARDIDRFISLFADDAIMILPDGRQLSGAPAIREMELSVFASSSPPSPTPVAIVASRDSVAVEIDVQLPTGQVLRMANFFQLNGEGRIQRLSVYRKTG
jgi:ketosteroid isomerase-like protein